MNSIRRNLAYSSVTETRIPWVSGKLTGENESSLGSHLFLWKAFANKLAVILQKIVKNNVYLDEEVDLFPITTQ